MNSNKPKRKIIGKKNQQIEKHKTIIVLSYNNSVVILEFICETLIEFEQLHISFSFDDHLIFCVFLSFSCFFFSY